MHSFSDIYSLCYCCIAGWRKFWSRRENRPYFFNRVTGDTMWEMPPFHNSQQQQQQQQHPPQAGFDRNPDPLGINQNGPPTNGPPPPHHHHPHPHHPPHHPHQHPQHPHPHAHPSGLKRRPSEELGGQVPPAKRHMIVPGPWDLEIPTNAIIFERKLSQLHHPHPEVELLRFSYVMKLRQSFQEMCHSRESEVLL